MATRFAQSRLRRDKDVAIRHTQVARNLLIFPNFLEIISYDGKKGAGAHIYFVNMAKTKAAGTTRLGRDSQPKYLGIKLFSGEKTKPGNIIVRQRGTKFLPGKNVKRGRDNTLYALKEGVVKYITKSKRTFNKARKIVKVVNVE